MELGVYSFGELTPAAGGGAAVSPRQRVKEMVDAAILADQVGLDVFGVGEHHRPDFAVSAYPVVLAAIAQATRRIRVTSANTVLSSSDPVRVFEEFATLDLLSQGRAEAIVGRGAYAESFPLFGYDIADYDALFEEKLGLLRQIAAGGPVTWRGRFRPPLKDAEIAPRPLQDPFPIWVAVGGTPASAVRAGRLGHPMALALIGGTADTSAAPLAELYRRAGAEAGHAAADLPIAVFSHLHVAGTSQLAREEFFPHYAHYLDYHSGGRMRVTRASYEQAAGPKGALFVGSPQEIIDKIAWEHEVLGHQRFLAQADIGGLPYPAVARAIELLGTEVLPVLRRELPATPTVDSRGTVA